MIIKVFFVFCTRHPEFISGPRTYKAAFLLRDADTGLRRHDELPMRDCVLSGRHAGEGRYLARERQSFYCEVLK